MAEEQTQGLDFVPEVCGFFCYNKESMVIGADREPEQWKRSTTCENDGQVRTHQQRQRS